MDRKRTKLELLFAFIINATAIYNYFFRGGELLSTHTFCFSVLMSAICYFVGDNYYLIFDKIKSRSYENSDSK
ncbi:colicin V immunity protein [Escherichia coli]|uniref:colicin transporter n=1 Tax=Escherichia coli TaxID=562 RepID=UPI000F63C61E|nr:colicin transporter [Escherichia coli]EEZ5226402.1 colicin transporter [Escherichia coli]EFA7708791.1 colicin transporter [Escherichia coli]EFH4982242.1 colicin transporter [Escherichia coli]EFH7212614.1 colicin transporter [Escherichia coli]EGJ4914410.1 colicin transporter [Escherichia coli]